MRFEIILTEQAEMDLREIYEYISFELQAPLNAEKQLSVFEHHLSNLADFPEGHRLYDQEPWKSRGLRMLPMGNYLAFYLPNNEQQTITVIRIMDGGRDIESQLKM